jgi:hypothetical protein
MFDCRNNLRSCAAALLFFAAGGVFCSAQPAPAANSPLFSKPADGGIMSPESSEQLPVEISSERPLRSLDPGGNLPPPSPDFNPALQQQLKQRGLWTLQTPEEIMGLQTPEQIFGLKQEDEDISPEERFLKREDKAKIKAANDESSDLDNERHGFNTVFDRPDDHDPIFAPRSQNDPSAFSQMFGKSEASPFVHRNAGLTTGNPMALSAADKAKADRDEAAEMARFRSLIGELPQTQNAAFDLQHNEAKPDPQPLSAFDVFGHPVTTHAIDVSKPEGLTLPPEIVGYNTPVRKAKKPSWEPQPPPWLSGNDTPPGTPPVRKFY